MNDINEILNRWAIWRFSGGCVDFEGYKSIFDTDNPVKGEVSSRGRLEKIPDDSRMRFINNYIDNKLTEAERLVVIIEYRADARVPVFKNVSEKAAHLGISDKYYRKKICLVRKKISANIC